MKVLLQLTKRRKTGCFFHFLLLLIEGSLALGTIYLSLDLQHLQFLFVFSLQEATSFPATNVPV